VERRERRGRLALPGKGAGGAVSVAAASIVALSVGAAWAVRGRSSAVFAPSRWRGDRRRKSIALTFDDGPSPSTPRLLELLSLYGVRATFFAVGRNVERHPAIAREIVAAGHDIENHSYSHPLFAGKRPSFVEEEFARAQRAITSATDRTARWLRAPYGVRWFGFREAQKRLGLEAVMWSVIGLDWKLPAPAIAQKVLARITKGDIICLHDGRGTLENPNIGPTIEAVRRILPVLLDAGYHFETISEILWAPTQSLTTN
jgi:peptidoglycan/xylan/chitin deacetylase (PgdA/CDA1 family)